MMLPFFSISVTGHATEVAFAGFAYSGDAQSVTSRFPYSKRFEESLVPKSVNEVLQEDIPSIQPQGYQLVPRISNLNGRDQAVAVALMVTNETVSTEQFGPIFKLFVQIRGQALFFDFKSQAILRAYPFSFAYLDAFPAPPTESQKIASISHVYYGVDGKLGIFKRFEQALKQATIPTDVPRFVQVADVTISDEARSYFPSQYADGVSETWVADVFGEAIANKLDIPMLPFAKGYAIGGVMPMTVADGTVYNLKVPDPDYRFSINLSQLRKIVLEQKASGQGLVYGAYASVKLEEPSLPRVYLDGEFKNGASKIVPSLQVNTEDFPAFQDAIRGLFTKLSGAIAGENTSWLKSASSASDISKQISATRDLLKSCK